jgi:hypothetical protein
LDWLGGSWWDVLRHAVSLMEDILSPYYKCILSAINQKLNICGHMLIWTSFIFWYVELMQKFVCSFQLHPVYAFQVSPMFEGIAKNQFRILSVFLYCSVYL